MELHCPQCTTIKKYNLPKVNYIQSRNYADRVISLPVYPKLSNENIKYICKTINKYI